MYKLPEPWQFKDYASAGSLRLRLSGLQSRCHLISRYTYPSTDCPDRIHSLIQPKVDKRNRVRFCGSFGQSAVVCESHSVPKRFLFHVPGIPKTPVFGVVHGKTPDFGVVRERPQKCILRCFDRIWYTSYVMKTWRFIIQERAFFVMVHDFICIYLGEIWPIYRKNHANIPTSRNPNDMLHIFNLYKYMYTYNVHAVMSSIVWTRRLSLLTPLQSGGGGIFHGFLTFFFTHFWGRC